jgi:hypothetical protein
LACISLAGGGVAGGFASLVSSSVLVFGQLFGGVFG